MMQTYHQSSQGSSDDSPSSHSIQVIHHVFNIVLKVFTADRFLFQNGWNTCITTISTCELDSIYKYVGVICRSMQKINTGQLLRVLQDYKGWSLW